MSDPIGSRALLLEQLESRCLLAGGIFWQTASHDNGPAHRSTAGDHADRPAMVASRQAEASQQPQSRIEVPTMEDQAIFSPRWEMRGTGSSGFDSHLINRPRPESLGSMPNQPEPINQQIILLLPLNGGSGNSISIGLETNDSATRPGRAVAVGSPAGGTSTLGAVTAQNSTAVDTTFASLSPDSETHKSESAVSAQPERSSNSVVQLGVSARELTDVGIVSNASTRADLSIQPSHAATFSQGQDDQIAGGIVELGPRAWHEFEHAESSPPEEAWELDISSLYELRKVADSANVDDTGFDQAAFDLAISNWFGQPTGLIDDIQCQSGLPAILHDVSPTIVDVVLDATVGLHRSFGLIAQSETETQPNAIRDAILAAIAAERPSLIEPLPEQTSARFSGLGYPGIAVVATSLAIADRRRRNNKLESTRTR